MVLLLSDCYEIQWLFGPDRSVFFFSSKLNAELMFWWNGYAPFDWKMGTGVVPFQLKLKIGNWIWTKNASNF